MRVDADERQMLMPLCRFRDAAATLIRSPLPDAAFADFL